MKCQECGKEFKEHQRTDKYCSRTCQRRTYTRNRRGHYSKHEDEPRSVEITDIKFGYTYFIPKSEYEFFKQAYEETGEYKARIIEG